MAKGRRRSHREAKKPKAAKKLTGGRGEIIPAIGHSRAGKKGSE
jgi:hypothetical protein